MKALIEINLDNDVQTFDDLITCLQATAGTLSDSTAILYHGETAMVIDADGNTVGKLRVIA